jgi:hypothetical protein
MARTPEAKKRKTSGVRYFYDLPVYRVSQDAYQRELEAYYEKKIFEKPHADRIREHYKRNPRLLEQVKQFYWSKFGGAWQFNEIVGYIRLHFLGSQVRGEWIAMPRSAGRRTRKKQFEYLAWKLAPEVDIAGPLNRRNVLTAIRRYIDACRRELPRNRYIDTEQFEELAPFVDWVRYLGWPKATRNR